MLVLSICQRYWSESNKLSLVNSLAIRYGLRALPPAFIEEEPTLTVQLRESTIGKIREVSWNESKAGSGGFTYDEIILHLIDSYHDHNSSSQILYSQVKSL
jgi:hypothetical protein